MKTFLALVMFASSLAYADTTCFDGSNGTALNKIIKKSIIRTPGCPDDQSDCPDQQTVFEYNLLYQIIPLNADADAKKDGLKSSDRYHCYVGTTLDMSSPYDDIDDINYQIHAYDLFPAEELPQGAIYISESK